MASLITFAPDLAAANSFLDTLAPGAKFTFQTLPEGLYDGHRQPPTIIHGTLAEVAARLAALNNAGHGIYVVPNEGDLVGRSATNVNRVRALWLDLDHAPLEPVLNSDLPPHIIVETSPGRWHVYWIVADCPLDQFKVRQQALAARFDGDKAVCDLPRVMRLPGFFHLKGETPFQSKLLKPNAAGK